MNVMNINRCGYLLATFILLASAACSKMSETDPGITQDSDGAFIETLSLKLDTKVTLSDNLEAAWDNGDKIAVWTGTSETEGGFQTCMLSSNSITVSFQDETYHRYNYAVHYCGETLPSYTDNVLSVSLPDMYDYSEVSGTRNPVPMVAKNLSTDGSTLSFRAVGALVRITLDGIPASTKHLKVMFDKDVTGSFVVSDPDSDAPYISTSDASDMNVVTVTLPTEDNYAQYAGAAINVPVPQGEVSVTSVKAYDSEGVLLATNVNGVLVSKWNALRAHAKKAKATFNPSFHNLIIAPGNFYTENGEMKISNCAYTHFYNGAATYADNEETYSAANRTFFLWNELSIMFNEGRMPTYAEAKTDQPAGGMSITYEGKEWHLGSAAEYKSLLGLAGEPQRPGANVSFTVNGANPNSKNKSRYMKLTVSDYEGENYGTGDLDTDKALMMRGLVLFPDNRNITLDFVSKSGNLDLATSNYAAKSISKATLDDLISQGCAFLPATGYFNVNTGAYQNWHVSVSIATSDPVKNDDTKFTWWNIEHSRIREPASTAKSSHALSVRLLRPVE